MKKIFLFFALYLTTTICINAQVDTVSADAPVLKAAETTIKKANKKYDLSKRANDHFLLQIGYTSWSGKPDSIDTKGFSKSINAYFMFDFPFKTTPQFSAAIGLGISSDQIKFDSTYVNVGGANSSSTSAYGTLRFDRSAYDGSNGYFKKTKLTTAYLEVPVELRYSRNPENPNKGFKVALGARGGLLVKAGTRNRKFTNSSVFPNDYTLKEKSRKFFNTSRVVGTLRAGYGHFTIFGNYQLTKLLKDGAGPTLHPFTIGLSFGGL
jgi:hypothetical protein